jgi:hypothetical protein
VQRNILKKRLYTIGFPQTFHGNIMHGANIFQKAGGTVWQGCRRGNKSTEYRTRNIEYRMSNGSENFEVNEY